MTQMEALEEQKQVFIAQKEEVENKRVDIYTRKQNAIKDALLPFFEDFSEGVEIEVHRGSVYFKMDHPEYSHKKELFSLYLKEDWSEDGHTFKGVDLSYYTTSTNADDIWELNRLFLLGKVAGVVRWNHKELVDAANKVAPTFKEEYEAAYQLQNMISTAIGDTDVRIKKLIKERIEFDLKNEGVKFEGIAYIDLKHNYTARINSIKLIDFSPSGKKATAVFTWVHGGQEGREEGINVGRVTDQVLEYINIIQKELVD